MNKQQLRLEYLNRRKQLTKADFDKSCEKIKDHFLHHFNELSGKAVHIYLPIVNKHEVNTWPIINELWKQKAIVVTTKTHFEINQLGHYQLTAKSKLKNNKWGVPEPQGGQEFPVSSIELVVVPLLAFDQNGYRVGYGKGFYDRFLSRCKNETIKIGLSIFPAENQIDDVNQYDIPLDICVTPEKIYQF